jgi:cobaltochelatase CobS
MGVEEILGKFLVKNGTTYWQDGILTTAMKKGHWIVFDEINAALPEILFTLHSLLDDDRKILLPEKDNEIVIPHADFRFFATMNPPEEYAGTKDMNKALMSRFTAVLIVEVLSQQDEYKLLVDEKKADPKTAETLVRIATALRDEKVKENIFYFCSTRDLVQCAFLVNNGLTLDVAVKGSIINKMSLAEYEVVKKHFANIISKIESRGKSFPDIEKEWASSQTTIDSLNVQIRELTSAKDGIKSETIKKILESVETI